MRLTLAFRAALAAAMLLVSSPRAVAQMYEAIGTRAQGMGGAFVAVADDATATWWNPAGLATGAIASLVVERAQVLEPADAAERGPAWQARTGGFAVAYPSFGLSYYRLRVSEIRPSSATGAGDPGRQDQGAEGVDLRSIALSEFGATFVQSVGGHLFVASTLKLVRGDLAASPDDSPGAALDHLDRVASLDVSRETHANLDVGMMAVFDRVRIGVSVKHLRQPEFGEGPTGLELKRQARAGIAVFGAAAGVLDGVTAAVDADLTRTMTVVGDVRHVSAGAEAWFLRRRLGVRGGVSANTVGEVGHSMSAGISLGAGALYVDRAVTAGSDRSREGWGISVRLAF